TQPQIDLAQRLVELSFPSRVFFCNSGAEANEAAIKIARKWGARHRDGAFEIITTAGSFHGRTLAPVTAGGQQKYSDPFRPLPGGVPIGACLANPRADVFEPGDHGSTFGGNPLACTAALAVLHVIERDGLVAHAAEMGELLQSSLADLGAKAVRGQGLMQAFEFAEPRAKAFQLSCLDAGLIVNAVDDHSVRLVPPLVITAEEIDNAHAVM